MKAWKRDQKRLQAELHALRGFVEARLGEVKSEVQRLMATYARVVGQVQGVAQGKKASPPARAARPAAASAKSTDAVTALQGALEGHGQRKALASAGGQRDQLLRSLIPLYLARGLKGVEVNSGAISRFWKTHGVTYAGPNAAKALRGKPGHAKKAGSGWAITDAGVKYVERSLGARN
jgi:hypothetical protein